MSTSTGNSYDSSQKLHSFQSLPSSLKIYAQWDRFSILFSLLIMEACSIYSRIGRKSAIEWNFFLVQLFSCLFNSVFSPSIRILSQPGGGSLLSSSHLSTSPSSAGTCFPSSMHTSRVLTASSPSRVVESLTKKMILMHV